MNSVWGQQICLSSGRSPGPESAVIFDSISTLGTSTVDESLVDVSLANITGEIKIKQLSSYNSRVNYFYLLVTANQDQCERLCEYSRKSRLFLLVNGKVPLRCVVYFTHFTPSGRRETTNSLKVVGITKDPFMPLDVMEFGEEEVHFEAMEFIHHGDSLRYVLKSDNLQFTCWQ